METELSTAAEIRLCGKGEMGRGEEGEGGDGRGVVMEGA